VVVRETGCILPFWILSNNHHSNRIEIWAPKLRASGLESGFHSAEMAADESTS
jgi:hypothetical protein